MPLTPLQEKSEAKSSMRSSRAPWRPDILALSLSLALPRTSDSFKAGNITIEDFRRIYRAIAHRCEIHELFTIHSPNHRILSLPNLVGFLRNEQFQDNADETIASQLVAKFEPIEEGCGHSNTLSLEYFQFVLNSVCVHAGDIYVFVMFWLSAKRNKEMTFEGFIRYVTSEDCTIFKSEHRTVYQDMSRPLCEYFISSSHNTYLLSDQLIGSSHLWGYASALMKGCRCLEIDCWDGPNNDPVVYHGYTLTNKISFMTVIQVIDKYAFVVSDYPLILSLENHCSPKQQEVMVDYLKTILGDKLALKFKIMIKNKKIGTLEETLERKDMDSHGQTGEFEEEETSDDESNNELKRPEQSLVKKRQARWKSAAPPRKKQKIRKIKIALALSELVIYTKSQKFTSFEDSRKNQRFYETNSIGEAKARKLYYMRLFIANEFVQHTLRFLTRIYPRGIRTNSSNYNPQEFWNIGCQMGNGLKFPNPGVQMDLQIGKFSDNGGCGYILKPEFLRNENTQFNLYNISADHQPITLTIKLISGHQLPPSNLSRTNKADPLVILEIYGIPEDQTKQQSCVVKGNALCPRWNQTFTFDIRAPELALVRFVVEDQFSLASNYFLGQYTLPLLSINRGYRHVPLFSKLGVSLRPASLFVHVWYPRNNGIECEGKLDLWIKEAITSHVIMASHQNIVSFYGCRGVSGFFAAWAPAVCFAGVPGVVAAVAGAPGVVAAVAGAPGVVAGAPGVVAAVAGAPGVVAGAPGLVAAVAGAPGVVAGAPGVVAAVAGAPVAAVAGAPGVVAGAPGLVAAVAGAPGVVAGAPGVVAAVAGAPGVVAGAPGLVAGAPGVVAAVAGAPGVVAAVAGAPGVVAAVAGAPGVVAGAPGVVAGAPGVVAEVAGAPGVVAGAAAGGTVGVPF
ncbi:hypothetical protein E2320_004302 [Naja naja]|nr:hypothetical protein E2320_004302 [Naja naja]